MFGLKADSERYLAPEELFKELYFSLNDSIASLEFVQKYDNSNTLCLCFSVGIAIAIRFPMEIYDDSRVRSSMACDRSKLTENLCEFQQSTLIPVKTGRECTVEALNPPHPRLLPSTIPLITSISDASENDACLKRTIKYFA
ncbi:unnamed protein product [Toxocara canis]|uniref:Uncharacterized protein n=1 Tax=Toxocara canis TaxID=6265 RepID=A0A183VE37_TOXCA|nr:unnamed protein product [Toxocara canis]